MKKVGAAKIVYFCLYIFRKNKLEGKMKATADSHYLYNQHFYRVVMILPFTDAKTAQQGYSTQENLDST